MDAKSGYCQIEIDNTDTYKTAFISLYGPYRSVHMPFGRCNEPGTFQLTMNVILSSVTWKFAHVYRDDIVVFGKTLHQHIDRVQNFLSLLHCTAATFKLKKCEFYTDSIDFLGHVIHLRRLELASQTTNAICELQPSTNLTELRKILCFFNVFQRFVSSFAQIVAQLNQHLKNNQPSTFTPLNGNKLHVMKALKNALKSLPILVLHYSGGHMTLEIDAYNVQIGYVLLQKKTEDTTKPVRYWSCSLFDAEKRYDTTQRECLAIVRAIFHLRQYLERHRLTLCTEHDVLKWVFILADSTGRLR